MSAQKYRIKTENEMSKINSPQNKSRIEILCTIVFLIITIFLFYYVDTIVEQWISFIGGGPPNIIEKKLEKNDVDAQLYMGACFYIGLMGKKCDKKKAFEWFEKASLQGCVRWITLLRQNFCPVFSV